MTCSTSCSIVPPMLFLKHCTPQIHGLALAFTSGLGPFPTQKVMTSESNVAFLDLCKFEFFCWNLNSIRGCSLWFSHFYFVFVCVLEMKSKYTVHFHQSGSKSRVCIFDWGKTSSAALHYVVTLDNLQQKSNIWRESPWRETLWCTILIC